jgi:hypothetical protein
VRVVSSTGFHARDAAADAFDAPVVEAHPSLIA